MLAARGLPKKRRKKTTEPTLETSIIVAPTQTPIMACASQPIHFIEDSSTRNNNSCSATLIRSTSLEDSNQLELSNMVVALPCLGDHIPPLPPKKTNSKTKGKASSAAPDSPAMGTRSKNKSPAMNTRSKTKLMD